MFKPRVILVISFLIVVMASFLDHGVARLVGVIFASIGMLYAVVRLTMEESKRIKRMRNTELCPTCDGKGRVEKGEAL